jgi:hypothetical protein
MSFEEWMQAVDCRQYRLWPETVGNIAFGLSVNDLR